MKKTLFMLFIAVLLLCNLSLPVMAAAKVGDVVTIPIPYTCDYPPISVMASYSLSSGLAFVNAYGSERMSVFLKNESSFLGIPLTKATAGSVMLEVKVKEGSEQTIDVQQIAAIWLDKEGNEDSYINAPGVQVIMVDPPTRGALPETEKPETEENPVPKVGVYPNNTMCIMGPRLRDIAPGSTDKWYMVTPVDISQDGEQVFPLVASNMYRVGTAIVAVKEGQLTVNYRTLDGVTVHSEHLAIYPDLEAAVKQKAAGLDGVSFKPGEPISIADDLAGDTSVLLLMCNQVSYTTEVRGLSRFYSGAPDVKDVLAQMGQMIK